MSESNESAASSEQSENVGRGRYVFDSSGSSSENNRQRANTSPGSEETQDGIEREQSEHCSPTIFEEIDESGRVDRRIFDEFINRHRQLTNGPAELGCGVELDIVAVVEAMARYAGPEKRYIHEVIRYRTDIELIQILNGCSQMSRNRVFEFHGVHELPGFEHVHVGHLCPWINRECKCWTRTLQLGRKKSKPRPLDSLTKSDYESILRYLNSDGRRLLEVNSPRGKVRSFYGIKCVPHERVFGRRGKRSLEDCSVSDQESYHEPTRRSVIQLNREMDARDGKPSSAGRKLSPEELEEFILKNLTCPINAITRSKAWKISKYRYLNEEDRTVRRVVDYLKAEIHGYSYKRILELHNKGTSTFLCINNDLDTFYYSPHESMFLILELLRYQFTPQATENLDNLDKLVAKFIEVLYNFLERKTPKVNCLEVISEPSAGKNWFFDCISSFYINVGYIANFNRTQSFPLQDCFDRRILIWNEPNCESAAYDTIKMLFAGDPCAAKVKYKSDVTIYKTPIIVLSNKTAFPRSQAFTDRMLCYRWRSCPKLKEYKLYPHPMCWPLLLRWSHDNI